VIVLIIVLVIGGDVFYEKIKKDDGPEIIDADLVLKRDTTDNSSVDGDNDGLLDWQEALYGSDSNKFDTDGDGTGDGDEIKEGRDPTIPAPDDTLVKTQDLIDTDFDVPGYTPGSLTDTLSKDLFANYLNLKSENQLNAETGNELANSLANIAGSSAQVSNQYDRSDLNIIQNNKENLQNYGGVIAITILDHVSQLENTPRLNDTEYLNNVANTYSETAKFLTTIEIPEPVANVHLEIVNKLNNTSSIISELGEYETDPVKSLLAVQKAQINSEGEVQLYRSLANYFKDNDIIFNDTRVARFWNLFE
jgi:hypothetical protein